MNRNSLLRKPLAFEGRFTQFPNLWARDNRIGYRAKGILILLMSHTDGWRISLEHLATDSPDGITAIRTAVQQLEDAGYLTRTLVRNDKAQVEYSEWVISDPFDLQSDDFVNDELENLTSENLISENLTSGNLTLKNTNIKNTNIREYQDKEIPSDFDRFWKIYPRKVGVGAARTAFEKACRKTEPDTIIEAITQYAQQPNLPDLQFIPHASTWLNQERWNDDLSAIGSNPTTLARDILQRGKELEQRVKGMLENDN